MPNDETRGRHRRLALVGGAALIVIVAVVAWVSLSTGDTDDDRRTIATELVDRWSEGWSVDDPKP